MEGLPEWISTGASSVCKTLARKKRWNGKITTVLTVLYDTPDAGYAT
jgi:hypothetical protein